MSSRACKESKSLRNKRLFTTVQLLYIMEEEAKKKPFLKRLKCCFFYLFSKGLMYFSRLKTTGYGYV